MEEQVVGTITKSDSIQTRISLSSYKGIDYINIREWFTKGNNEWFPSNKGIALATSKVGDLVTLIEKAEEVIMEDNINKKVS